MELSVRAGRHEDWEAMRRVFARAGQAAWAEILSASILAGLAAPDRWHPSDGAEVIVAEREGEVIGFVCVRASADDDADPTVGEIDACYVLPSAWGQGVGRALLAAAVGRLVASGYQQATLWTEHRNERPLRFYRAAGWTRDGAERRRIYRGVELLELRHRVILTFVSGARSGTAGR